MTSITHCFLIVAIIINAIDIHFQDKSEQACSSSDKFSVRDNAKASYRKEDKSDPFII